MALRTTIRKQGDVVTERTTDSGSEFRVSTTHFINPQTGVCIMNYDNRLEETFIQR
jgi:hypothetical protein